MMWGPVGVVWLGLVVWYWKGSVGFLGVFFEKGFKSVLFPVDCLLSYVNGAGAEIS